MTTIKKDYKRRERKTFFFVLLVFLSGMLVTLGIIISLQLETATSFNLIYLLLNGYSGYCNIFIVG